MRALAQLGKVWAHPLMSHFEVAAIGLTTSGALLIGVNLEFPPLPLNFSVHAEQFLIERLFD